MFELFFKNLSLSFDEEEKIKDLLFYNLENRGKIAQYILKNQRTMNKQHKLELIRRLKISRWRHNETPYDLVLQDGHSRATARHFIV